MANLQDILLPDAGGEVDVTEILVSVGDTIEPEQSLIAVEGDKAAMEVPSETAGVVREILVSVGDKIDEGALILRVESGAAAEAAAPAVESAPAEPAPAPAAEPAATAVAEPAPAAAPAASATSEIKEVLLPDAGGEVDVTEILVAVGDSIEEEQSLVAVEGDKAAMEVPSPFAGKVTEISVTVGDKINEGSLVVKLEVAGAAPVAAQATAAAAAQPSQAPAVSSVPKPPPVATDHPMQHAPQKSGTKVFASPAIRRLAREFGVDLSQVSGSGRKNRILKEDVQAYVKAELARPKANAAGAGGAGGGNVSLIDWPKVDFAKFGEVEEVPLTRIQKISGPNLHRNWVSIPHVTQFDETDIGELEAFRKEQNALNARLDNGVKHTPLVFILKAAAKALELHPKFNASLSADGESLVMKKYVHIGIAVDTPNGLVVPVIRDVNKKGLNELSQEMAEISKKARAGKLTAREMQGGCFTISSLGGIGGTQFTPIVNAPEVAILGVSRSEMKPKWNGSEFKPQLMLPLALSYDHRVIDGADGARFITTLSGLLGDLRRLVL